MKTISFTIRGNQEDPRGNAIPYMRSTQGGQWKPKVMRYHEWQNYVRANYLDALGAIKKIDRKDFGDMHDLLERKPIAKSNNKIHMRLMIQWKDRTHADADNIFKGIADSLFMNDKYLSGEFDYGYGVEGYVDVQITFY